MGLFSSSSKKSSGIFIPQNGGFAELTNEIENTSIIGISHFLGYHEDQIHTYHTDYNENEDIMNVVFEVFTNNIIFVLTKSTCSKVSSRDVSHRIRSFKWEEEYDSYTVNDILEKGVANKSLTLEFLARVLDFDGNEPTGIFPVQAIGCYLYFNEGVLTDFQSLDGLDTWAKYFQQLNSTTITLQETHARKYWGNNPTQIIKEVNAQSDALAGVPELFKNKFAPLHKTESGTINFVMLLVCHYNRAIGLPEFLEINHGRYQFINDTVYRLGNFIYEFANDGNLVKTTQLN